MMTLVVAAVLAFVLGAAVASIVCRGRLQQARDCAAALERELSEASGHAAELANLRAQLRGLRHDLRGILSPALLVSDRLLTHGEPSIKRAGEVMVRTVERCNQRLTESRLDQGPPISPAPVQPAPPPASIAASMPASTNAHL